MSQNETTKLRLTLSPFELNFAGSETFLRTEVPSLLQAIEKLLTSRLSLEARTLSQEVEDSQRALQVLADLTASTKHELDSMSELGETESLRLQMAMDRMSKLMTTLSNILKKISDTADGIVQNIK